jgi:hypothetical protein
MMQRVFMGVLIESASIVSLERAIHIATGITNRIKGEERVKF